MYTVFPICVTWLAEIPITVSASGRTRQQPQLSLLCNVPENKNITRDNSPVILTRKSGIFPWDNCIPSWTLDIGIFPWDNYFPSCWLAYRELFHGTFISFLLTGISVSVTLDNTTVFLIDWLIYRKVAHGSIVTRLHDWNIRTVTWNNRSPVWVNFTFIVDTFWKWTEITQIFAGNVLKALSNKSNTWKKITPPSGCHIMFG